MTEAGLKFHVRGDPSLYKDGTKDRTKAGQVDLSYGQITTGHPKKASIEHFMAGRFESDGLFPIGRETK